MSMQNRDGGWGLHIEGPSTMFGSVLNYVTLRLLGEEAEDGQGGVDKARKWILDHGGATAITSWGKMWLSVWSRVSDSLVYDLKSTVDLINVC